MTYPCQKCGKIWEQPDSDVNCGYASAHCVLCGGGVGLTRTIKKCNRCGRYGETRFCANCGGSVALVNEYLSPRKITPDDRSYTEEFIVCGDCGAQSSNRNSPSGHCVECGGKNWRLRVIEYRCVNCGDRWLFEPIDYVAYKDGGISLFCGNCGTTLQFSLHEERFRFGKSRYYYHKRGCHFHLSR